MSLHPSVAAVRRGVRGALESPPASGDNAGPVLVACSGGADSVALLAAAIFEGHKRGQRVIGVTVDHGLQADSGQRAAAVTEQMAAMGADETASVRVDVDATGVGVEAAARVARYDVLRQLAEHFGSAMVLLGHTRDDQAETVLLGLTRGSGARSLRGMRPGFDVFVRPLLAVTRADTETACLVEGHAAWSDPHNSDPAFTRARIRHQVMPLLERELGPGVAESLARTADGLREDSQALDELAEQTVAALTEPHQISVQALRDLPTAVRHRAIRLLALRAGALDAELFREHVLAVAALVTHWRGQLWIDLPGHVRAVRVSRRGKEPADVIRFEQQR